MAARKVCLRAGTLGDMTLCSVAWSILSQMRFHVVPNCMLTYRVLEPVSHFQQPYQQKHTDIHSKVRLGTDV